MVITYVPAFFNAVEVWVQVRVTCMATSPHYTPFIRLHTPSPPFSHALCHLLASPGARARQVGVAARRDRQAAHDARPHLPHHRQDDERAVAQAAGTRLMAISPFARLRTSSLAFARPLTSSHAIARHLTPSPAFAQGLIMLAFTETADVLDMPSSRHLMDFDCGTSAPPDRGSNPARSSPHHPLLVSLTSCAFHSSRVDSPFRTARRGRRRRVDVHDHPTDAPHQEAQARHRAEAEGVDPIHRRHRDRVGPRERRCAIP